MKKKTLFATLSCSSIIALTLTVPIIATSCKSETTTNSSSISNLQLFNDELDGVPYIDLYKYATQGNYDIHKASKGLGHAYSTNWYDSLGDAGNWNYAKPGDKVPENLYCSTKKQALALYLCNAGEFWNVELHENKIPTDKKDYYVGQKLGAYLFEGERLDIRGTDYEYISESLVDASIPSNTIVYHAVEFMEKEFYTQLQQYISQNSDGSYDYSKCVNQTITSYGFMSTSFDKKMVEGFAEGFNWIDGSWGDFALKDRFIFKIYIPANIKGAAYVSQFDFMGVQNIDDQILIDRNSEYKILKSYKEGNINYFDMLYLGLKENSNN